MRGSALFAKSGCGCIFAFRYAVCLLEGLFFPHIVFSLQRALVSCIGHVTKGVDRHAHQMFVCVHHLEAGAAPQKGRETFEIRLRCDADDLFGCRKIVWLIAQWGHLRSGIGDGAGHSLSTPLVPAPARPAIAGQGQTSKSVGVSQSNASPSSSPLNC